MMRMPLVLLCFARPGKMNRISLSICIRALLWLSSSSFCSCRHHKYAHCGVPIHCEEANVNYPLSFTAPSSTYYFNTSKGSEEVRPHSIRYDFRFDSAPPYTGIGIRVFNEAFSNVEETCTLPQKEMELLYSADRFSTWMTDEIVLYGECNKPLPSNLTWSSTPNCSDPILLMFADDIYSHYAKKECKRMVELSLELRDREQLFIPSSEGGRVTNWSTYRTAVSRGIHIGCDSGDGPLCNCLFDGDIFSTCPHVSLIRKMAKPLGFSICGLVFIAIVTIMLIPPKEKRKENSKVITDFLRMNNKSLTLKRYKYSEIKKITRSFKNKLGQGGFGSVYKGELKDGRQVAVKILNSTKSDNGEDFMNEVTTISRTAHVNIVGLIGFCISGSKRALIYPFMANGSLEKFIYQEKLSGPQRILEWHKLHSIAVGIAQGLEYLHRGCTTRIVHFDIKPHNILLDEDFSPKISDFGLAKVCVRKESVVSVLGARGTVGYIAPEQACRSFGQVSHKSDVYSYGMMILEMVGGRKNVDAQVENASEIYFPHWIYKRLLLEQEFELDGIIDEDDKVLARKMIITGLWCIQTDPTERPPISRVVEMLQGSIDLLPVPPKPYMYSPPCSPQHCLAPVLTSSTQTISDPTSSFPTPECQTIRPE